MADRTDTEILVKDPNNLKQKKNYFSFYRTSWDCELILHKGFDLKRETDDSQTIIQAISFNLNAGNEKRFCFSSLEINEKLRAHPRSLLRMSHNL